MRLRWRGPVDRIGGYQLANFNLLMALDKLGHKIELFPDEVGLHNTVVLKMLNRRLEEKIPCVYFCPPMANMFGRMIGSRHICYTMFEADEIPDDWAYNINKRINNCFVVSKFCKEIFFKKIKKEIEVVSLGYNNEVFNPKVLPMAGLTNKIKFLTVTECQERKNLEQLIESFLVAFENNDNVLLILKLFVRNPGSKELLSRLLEKYIQCNKIWFLLNYFEEYELAALYRACDFYVSVANEGFNLPLLEALGSGLPAIVINKTGHMDFCKKDPAISFVNSKEKILDDEKYRGFNLYVPDEESLINEFRYNYNNIGQKKIDATIYQGYIKDNFSWENSAVNLIKTIDKIIS